MRKKRLPKPKTTRPKQGTMQKMVRAMNKRIRLPKLMPGAGIRT